MSNKKDQGNAHFKKQKYAEAIECYKQYVKEPHQDNSKAYNNMALCLYKQKKYRQSIAACQLTIQLDPSFEKPYYRMVQAYRQLKDYFNVVLMGSKYCTLLKDQKQAKDILRLISAARQKLISEVQKPKSASTQIDQVLHEVLSSELQQKEIFKKWPQVCLDTKWEKIAETMKVNLRQGKNLAFGFLSRQCLDLQTKSHYKHKFQKLRQQLSGKHRNHASDTSSEYQVEVDCDLPQSQVQWLTKKGHQNEQQIKETNENVQKKDQPEPKPVQLTASNGQQTIQKNQANPIQHHIAQSAKVVLEPSAPVQRLPTVKHSIDHDRCSELYTLYVSSRLLTHSDLFDGFYQVIGQVLGASLDNEQKKAVLIETATKLKRFRQIIKTFTVRQKQKLKYKFIEAGMLDVMEEIYFKV